MNADSLIKALRCFVALRGLVQTIYCDNGTNLHWKVAQAAAEEFWRIWRSEYLKSITIRQKWTKAKLNVKEEDIVIVKDSQVARNDWKLGIVTEAIEGSDGLARNLMIRWEKNCLCNHPQF